MSTVPSCIGGFLWIDVIISICVYCSYFGCKKGVIAPYLFILLGCDRASVNDVVSRWILWQVMQLDITASVSVAVDYCIPHGVAVAKTRYGAAETKGQEVSTHSKKLRDGRFKNELVETAYKMI